MVIEKFCKVTTNFYYKNPDNFKTIINGGNEMRSSVKEGKYKVITFAESFNLDSFCENGELYLTIFYVSNSGQ